MGRRLGAWLACGALALSACARPDASGIYLAKSDREAAMIQLVQTGDGAVTGRVEVVQMWGRPESVREEFRVRRAQ